MSLFLNILGFCVFYTVDKSQLAIWIHVWCTKRKKSKVQIWISPVSTKPCVCLSIESSSKKKEVK